MPADLFVQDGQPYGELESAPTRPSAFITDARPPPTSVAEIIIEQHGNRVCSYKDVLMIIGLLVVVGVFGYFVNTQEENLAAIAGVFEDLGLRTCSCQQVAVHVYNCWCEWLLRVQ